MPSVLIGGAKVNISGNSAEFEKSMRKVSTLFDKQTKELDRHRKRLARTNKAYAAVGKSLKSIAGIAVGAALAGLAKANLDNAKATAEWGSNLVKVSDRLAVLPSELFALQSAFEDDNVAIQTTNQNLTALSRRFASDAPAMRRAADKVGISLKEWDATGGDLAKLLPIISKAMQGTATQAAKLNFLQEAGSTSARKFLTTLQRANFDQIVEGYRSTNSELDKTAKKLEDLDQLFTNIERREKLAIADTISKNIKGYERFAKRLSDIKVEFIEIQGVMGTLLERLDAASEKAKIVGNAQVLARGGDIEGALKITQGNKDTSKSPLEVKIKYEAPPVHVISDPIEEFLTKSAASVDGRSFLKTGKYWERIGEESADAAREAGEKSAKAWNDAIDRIFTNTDQRMMDDSLMVGVDRIIKATLDKQKQAKEEAKKYEEQYALWVEETQKRIADSSIAQIERQEQAMEDFVNSVQIDLFDMEKTFKNVLNRMATELTNFAITGKSDFFSGIGDFLGGLFGGGGGLFGRNDRSPGTPHLSGGGYLRAGQAAYVGEFGKEKIIPMVNSQVIPNNRLGESVSNTINMSFNINGGDEAGVERALYRLTPILQEAVMKNLMKNGSLNTEFRGMLGRAAERR